MGPKKLDREPRCIMEQFTKHKEGQLDDQDKVVLRLLPDLPSATISRVVLRQVLCCGCSPISHRLQLPAWPGSCSSSCGCSPISHRLQYSVVRQCPYCVAVAPRSPIGYNLTGLCLQQTVLRLLPDLPSATIQLVVVTGTAWLRLLPDLPSATISAGIGSGAGQLRLLPDLPSATMNRSTVRNLDSCGCSPISHRLQ